MIIYTLVVTENAVTVHDGILARARLRYTADNFRIYTLGAIPDRKFDVVAYHALELAIAHHIPAMTVRRHIAEGSSKNDY